ncbi:MAG: hypothetical protein V5789_05130 [Colwellia sp.]
MNTKKNNAPNKVTNGLQPEVNKTDKTANADSDYVILFTGEAPKLSAKSSGTIGFEIGQQIESKQNYLRLTTNSSAGLYSKKWFSLSAFVDLLNNRKDEKPFKTSLFKCIVAGGSSNTISFIAATLRCKSVGLIAASPNNLYLHVVSDDFDKRVTDLNKLTPPSTDKLTTPKTPVKSTK